jgi:hypothetical protein
MRNDRKSGADSSKRIYKNYNKNWGDCFFRYGVPLTREGKQKRPASWTLIEYKYTQRLLVEPERGMKPTPRRGFKKLKNKGKSECQEQKEVPGAKRNTYKKMAKSEQYREQKETHTKKWQKANSTEASHAVTHRTTDSARRSLTSGIGRDPVQFA